MVVSKGAHVDVHEEESESESEWDLKWKASTNDRTILMWSPEFGRAMAREFLRDLQGFHRWGDVPDTKREPAMQNLGNQNIFETRLWRKENSRTGG